MNVDPHTMNTRGSSRSLLALYRDTSFFTKIHVFLRITSCPFQELLSYIPDHGRILDIGCGYGILLLFLARRNPKLHALGIDPDAKRITAAKKAAGEHRRLAFQAISIEKLPLKNKFDVITLIDVLYLLPWDQKRTMLRAAYKLLRPKGFIVVKINDHSFSLSYFLTWLQEVVTVLILKKTSTKHRGLYFESSKDIQELLAEEGFCVKTSVRLPTPFPFFHQHNLVIGVK